MARETRQALILCAGFLLLWIVWGQLSPGTYDDDDVTHYFVARESLEEPSNLISLWARPLFTAVYALPAQLGYGAVEVLTALIMAVTLFLTFRVARRLDIQPAWMVIPFTAWQPILFKLGFSSLVEPIGALALIAALDAILSRRDRTAALVAGLLPLARFELIVLVPFLLVPLLRRARVTTVALVAVPMLLWNIGGWIFEGDPIWLASQILGNEFGRSFAGARPLHHYVQAFPFVTGGVLLVPVLLGFAAPWRGRHELSIVRVLLLVFLGTLSFLAWDAHEFGGSVGYLRHVVAVGPLIGIVAAYGLMSWRSRATVPGWAAIVVAVGAGLAVCGLRVYMEVYEHPVNRTVEPWMTAAAAVAVGLVVVVSRTRAWLPVAVAVLAGAVTVISEPPIPLDVEREGMRQAVEIVTEHGRGEAVAVNHPFYLFLADADRLDTLRYPRLTMANLERLRPGSFVVWENHYSNRLAGDVELEHFAAHPTRYLPRAKDQIERRSLDGTVTSVFLYVVFEVVRPDDPRLNL